MASEESPGRRVLSIALRWAWRAAVALLLFGGIGMVAVALTIRRFESDLPKTAELRKYTPPQVTRILARDGTLLGEDFVERRTVVKLDEIPSHVKLAFLAAEDASFYEHEGLDYPGMLRAMWINLRSQSSRQGASTITQQVVKNVLLTQDRTYERKIKEVILSRRIEQELSKDEILELYLNQIYFGHGRYGVEEASRYFFGKGTAELTLGEAALLASIPKGPTRYSPREHLERTLARRSYVLRQMEDKGFGESAALEEANLEEVALAPVPELMGELAPEVIAEARRTLREIVGPAADRGGYTVTTTIDPKLQGAARKAVRDGLDGHAKRQKLLAPIRKAKGTPTYFEGDPLVTKQPVYVGEVTGADDAKNEIFVRVGSIKGKVDLSHATRYNPQKLAASKFAEVGAQLRVSVVTIGEKSALGRYDSARLRLELGAQAAVVLIDLRTRDILAIAGSYEAQAGGLDRATNAHRQPGSAFKPFIYSYALHARRFTPATMVPTDPAVLEGYRPRNYDGKGGEPVRLRQALSKSINVSAVWLVGQVGPANAAAWAESLGIESKLGPTPSIALGAYEVTPRELTNAYASIAAGGVVESPRLILGIVGPDGEEIALPPLPDKRRAMTEAEAYATTDLLKSVVTEGTGRGALVLKRPIAGKTGTSNELRDAWFAGYSTEIACAAWVGYDDQKPLGPGEAGGATALPIFVELMRAAHQGMPATDFPVPEGITRVSVDPATGLLARTDQTDAMTEVFLTGAEPTDTAADPNAPAEPSEGEVEPPAGTPAEPDPSAPIASAGPEPAPTEEAPPLLDTPPTL